MVVINHVVPILGSKNHGNEVFAEELLALALVFGPGLPLLALSRDLTHANRDLRRAEIRDRYRPEKRFPDVNHGVLLQLSKTAGGIMRISPAGAIANGRDGSGGKSKACVCGPQPADCRA